MTIVASAIAHQRTEPGGGAGFLRSACTTRGESRLHELHFVAISGGFGAGVGAEHAMNRRNRVLVTGGAGFLGSHLCERLLAEGCEVLCVDNYFTGSRDNIAAMLSNPSFEALRHDITLPLYVEVDQIYNLGCPASPIHYQFDPVQTIKVSVHGAINMLGLAKRVEHPFSRHQPAKCTAIPGCIRKRRTIGATSTRSGPARLLRRGQALRRDVVLRLPTPARYADQDRTDINTYGPRMFVGDGRVVSTFVARALRGDPLTVYGDGGQTRSFCYVDDVVDGLVKLMNTPREVTGPINLGNTREITILELAGMIIRLTGSKSGIIHEELPNDDPRRRRPDITKAGHVLGWTPSTPLETESRGRSAFSIVC